MSTVLGLIIIVAGLLFIFFQVKGLIKDHKKRKERKQSKVDTEKEPINQDSSSDKK